MRNKAIIADVADQKLSHCLTMVFVFSSITNHALALRGCITAAQAENILIAIASACADALIVTIKHFTKKLKNSDALVLICKTKRTASDLFYLQKAVANLCFFDAQ